MVTSFLADCLFTFLDANRKFAQFYDPLTHNKHFLMDFVTAYRKPYCLKVGKGSKKIYVNCKESDLPGDVKVLSTKQTRITKNDLGVGMLCWHSKGNFDGMHVIESNKPPLPLQLVSKKRKKNRPSKSQRKRQKVNTGFS